MERGITKKIKLGNKFAIDELVIEKTKKVKYGTKIKS